MVETLFGFPLTRHQRDTAQGIELSYWLVTDQGPRCVTLPRQEAVFFVRQQDLAKIEQALKDLKGWRCQPLALHNLRNEAVAGLYTSSLKQLNRLIDRLTALQIPMMEEDIRPVDRYLMERFIYAGARYLVIDGKPRLAPCDYHPTLRVFSFDIETTLKADRILSIAYQSEEESKVLMVGEPQPYPAIHYVPDEASLLMQFMADLKRIDPDVLIGWNVIGFDLRVLQKRAEALGISLVLGRDQQPLKVGSYGSNRHYARLAGRVVLDGIDSLKGATWHFERYSLEFVAQTLLNRGKAIDSVSDRGESIQRMYAHDQRALAHYNLEDCRLVSEIFKKTALIEYFIERTRLTGLALDKVGGSAQAFDNMYLPALHRAGYVGPQYASGETGAHVPGGHVMDSQPGLYRNVLVLDFKSLYPSIIRTFKIDPLGLTLGLSDQQAGHANVPGFLGAHFSREHAILPGIIERLWLARDEAKAAGRQAMSQAIKIQMNACYGVLGSNVCRFYDQRLSASITCRGQQILTETAAQIEAEFGYQVIYGDTDSVFVWVGDELSPSEANAIGPQLAQRLNGWWQEKLANDFQLTSALELQYETCYRRFLMPRMRDSEFGSKKRYAGLRWQVGAPEQLIFKGLENVRSDWTQLAKSFQRDLYEQVFSDQPCQEMVKQRVLQLLAGELNEQLCYHRRLRRPLHTYQRNIPPHVRAARQLSNHYQQKGMPNPLHQGDTVAYLMTLQGPEAAEISQSAIDYSHYIDKQLRPVADSILPFIGLSFDDLIQPQLSLF